MSLRIVLLTPARRFIANRFGLGYQIPLGLVLIGGPLVDAGHTVRLLDNDLYGWDHSRLIAALRGFRPDLVMIGHSGSTAAHSVCRETARAVRDAFPDVRIVYGGVFPSYAAEHVLRECPAIDVVVRGEGETTCVALAEAWDRGESLGEIAGITWRDGETIRANRASLFDGIRVVCAEILEFVFATRFAPLGSLDHIPGDPSPRSSGTGVASARVPHCELVPVQGERHAS